MLRLIETLAHELNPERAVRVTPGASLQRDLGFDSLGIAELLMRVEREFKVRLPDDLIGRVETPLDLLAEIEKSGAGEAHMIVRSTDRLPGGEVEALPLEEPTLTGVLDWHVRHSPERTHVLLSDGYRETETISYAQLMQAAARVANALRSWGLEPRERVGIMLPTGAEFFEAFFGAMLAGGTPVPMYPPARLSQLEEHLRRQAGILRNSEAALLILSEEGRQLAGLLAGQIETLRGVRTVKDLQGQPGTQFGARPSADDLAMLQYTSGSTGAPKGVMLSHANLLANIRSMGSAIEATSRDVFVSWLPLYHDLGLIGAWLGSLYYAAPVVIMSPMRFIVRPESWLWAIHRNSATLSAAPNFAFELCVNKVDDAALEGLDLSSLRMVANGAEPVSAETIRRFTERFARYGFRPEAMTPVYGLAEDSVGLAFSSPLRKPIMDRISRAGLSQNGRAIVAEAGDAHPMTFVSSGVPLPGHEIRIVDDLGRELAERHQGRLEFRGPSATRGYFRDPGKTRALFHDGWLDSGDLAYIANGNVFITGRIKDIIIKGGRNIYPEEIEEAVGNLPGARKGCVAAFASPDPRTGSERLIVVAETRSTDPQARDQLQQAVSEVVSDVLGMPADEVVIAPPHAVPKTSSGKIRRSTTRELYDSGKLGQPVRALWLQILRLRLTSMLARVRRLAGAASDLAYAAWWWSILVLLGAFTWPVVLLLPTRRGRWSLVRRAARTALWLMRVPLSVEGEAHYPRTAAVVAANHSSYFDALVLAAALPGEPVFIAKSELTGQLVAGPFLRRLGAHFAEREIAQAGLRNVEAFRQLLREDVQLVMFPEATFFRMPGLLSFRLGAFTIACAAGVPLLPVVIGGTRSILRGEQWFPRRGAVRVEMLEPITPEGSDFAAAIRLRDEARARMLSRCDEPDMAASDVAQQRQANDQSAD